MIDTRKPVTQKRASVVTHGKCQILETVTKTVGKVEWMGSYAHASLEFDGACVTGRAVAQSRVDIPPAEAKLVGLTGEEVHEFTIAAGEGCEIVDCKIGAVCFAAGALDATVDRSGNHADAHVVISLPDQEPIDVEVDVDPTISKEDEDKKQIHVHGALSGSAPVHGAQASGGVTFDFKWVWRKKGPNHENAPVDVSITLPAKGCSPPPILRASTTVNLYARADTSLASAPEVTVSFEKVGIRTSGAIDCDCDDGQEREHRQASRHVRSEKQNAQHDEVAKQAEALRTARAALAGSDSEARPEPAARLDAELTAQLLEQTRVAAEAAVTDAQWNEVEALRRRAIGRAAQFTPASDYATRIRAARIDSQLKLLEIVARSLDEGFAFADDHLAEILADGQTLLG